MRVSSRFTNADIEVTDPAETSYDGSSSTSATTVLTCRCFFQSQGRTLQYLRQEHEKADGLAFCSKDISPVEPGHEVEIDFDDSRPIEKGTVQEVFPVDDKLLVTLR